MADPYDRSRQERHTNPTGPGPSEVPRGPWERARRSGPEEGGSYASGAAGGPGRGEPARGPEEWARALGGHPTECLDWCPICRTADVLRATTSPELREQFQQFQREALVTVRALIDHYIERLDEQPRRATPVEEIPIE